MKRGCWNCIGPAAPFFMRRSGQTLALTRLSRVLLCFLMTSFSCRCGGGLQARGESGPTRSAQWKKAYQSLRCPVRAVTVFFARAIFRHQDSVWTPMAEARWRAQIVSTHAANISIGSIIHLHVLRIFVDSRWITDFSHFCGDRFNSLPAAVTGSLMLHP